ncbi:hypothetical protein RFI_05666 [Reticulomyxa filosa]|uniref:Uncharacterized protein n=1 Tax=Reticulomyxa filosa TaxID=46433 RepID=X6P1M8_RETFI|nr:hypothetical protein RFI_05666 [Reticulomyxa filosa]|eukprot:ETO31452.1 hypothetical protein RFI_05666 [Reticulomyxa filosa]
MLIKDQHKQQNKTKQNKTRHINECLLLLVLGVICDVMYALLRHISELFLETVKDFPNVINHSSPMDKQLVIALVKHGAEHGDTRLAKACNEWLTNVESNAIRWLDTNILLGEWIESHVLSSSLKYLSKQVCKVCDIEKEIADCMYHEASHDAYALYVTLAALQQFFTSVGVFRKAISVS